MTKLIMDTDAALFEALGHMTKASLLIGGTLNQDADTYELTDANSLLADAISQLKGEIANRMEMRGAA